MNYIVYMINIIQDNMTKPKKSKIVRIGGDSAGVILNKGALEVFGLEIGDQIEVEYRIDITPPEIVIRKLKI